MNRNKKILFYSHDTFGLGHIRRTQKIANQVAKSDRSILIACASPKASSFASASGIEYLNLPGFTKQISGEYSPRSLNIPTDQFVNLRSSLLLSAVRSFNPDLVVIDKEPLGVKKELLPALEYLRNFHKHTKIVCGFRDILDDWDSVKKEWFKRDTERALNEYFDEILVYGEESIYNFAQEYHLSKNLSDKITYTGYLNPGAQADEEFHFPANSKDKAIVTFTLGGGGDGWDFLECFLKLLELNLHQDSYRAYILTGPFCEQRLLKKARDLSETRKDIVVSEFISNAPSLFKASDLVISMGGYNTFCELLSMQKYPLILPRTVPRKEQLLRAQVFASQGFCNYIEPEMVNPENLQKEISMALDKIKSGYKAPIFKADGLNKISEIFDQWLK